MLDAAPLRNPPPADLVLELGRDLAARGYHRRARQALVMAGRLGAEGTKARVRKLDGVMGLLGGSPDPDLDPQDVGERVPGRVLHVVKQVLADTQAGYTLRTHRTAVAQATAGRDVHVVSQLGRGDATPVRWETDGVTYHRLPGPEQGSMRQDLWFDQYAAALADLVVELRPEVLHSASNYVYQRAARIAGAATATPTVYEVRGFWEETMISKLARDHGWGDLEALERRFGLPDTYLGNVSSEQREYRGADAVVTLAPVMKERIVAAGAAPERVHLVPNAISPEEFEPAPRDACLAAELGISDGTAVVGYVTSLSEYEGIDVLIEAYATLRSQRGAGSVVLLVVGDGPDRNRLESVVERVGPEGIILTGRVPHADVSRYYSLIDVFVVPRNRVAVCELVTPLKPYEAMALGKALVMSDVAALSGIAEESGCAELARAGDPDDFARVIGGLLDDPARRAKLAEAGRTWVVRNRTWEINAELYEQVYAQVLPTTA